MHSRARPPAVAAPGSFPGRRPYRHKLPSLTYVNVDDGNGGILRDLSERGFAMQAVARLQPEQPIRLRFELANPRVRVEGEGRVVWVDQQGQAGVEFVSLPERPHRQLKDWIFTQLLNSASKSFGPEFMSGPSESAGAEDGLTFSSAPRQAIRLVAKTPGPSLGQPWRVLWFSLSPETLARVVDGLALLCSVLLFGVIALAITGVMPTWPIALAITIGIAGLTLLLYRIVFGAVIGTTPGRRLAGVQRNAAQASSANVEDGVRFR
jgi:hypothetical protein